jgi:poly(beta-D-mannuronate) lyase
MKNEEMELQKDDAGFLIPVSKKINIQFVIDSSIAKLATTGVSWYEKGEKESALGSGKIIEVAPGSNTLYEAVKSSSPGDVLQLSPEKEYILTKTIEIDHPISIASATEIKSTILFEKKAPFVIQNGGALSLKGIVFDGKMAPDYSGNSVISTSKYSMNRNYKLFIDNCIFKDLDMNHSFDAIRVFKNTFADTISITNSEFRNITGNVLALDKEDDDNGVYNAEYVILNNNIFSKVQGMALRLYRGGKDESTFGPFLEMDHNVFDNVGHGKKNKYKVAISLYGVQVNNIENNIFNNAKALEMHLVVGEPIVNIFNNNFYKSEKLHITGDEKYNVENLWTFNPEFEEHTYKLSKESALIGKATDGLDLGVITNN